MAADIHPPTCADVYTEVQRIAEKAKIFNQLVTTDAKIRAAGHRKLVA